MCLKISLEIKSCRATGSTVFIWWLTARIHLSVGKSHKFLSYSVKVALEGYTVSEVRRRWFPIFVAMTHTSKCHFRVVVPGYLVLAPFPWWPRVNSDSTSQAHVLVSVRMFSIPVTDRRREVDTRKEEEHNTAEFLLTRAVLSKARIPSEPLEITLIDSGGGWSSQYRWNTQVQGSQVSIQIPSLLPLLFLPNQHKVLLYS